MRALTAIVVAVMSVTTGGPLRCPCQLAALCRAETRFGLATRTVPHQPESRCCSCESHAALGLPGPVEPKPPSNSPPCEHHPVIALAVLHAGAERVLDDRNPGDSTEAHGGNSDHVVSAHAANVAVHSATERSLPPCKHLRYSHAFRS